MSCETCYLRDLCALALVDRAWDRAVRPVLYGRIYIVGNDSTTSAKKFKMKSGVRLKLLRRTLRERRALAQLVREIKVPRLQPEGQMENPKTIDLVASLVMASISNLFLHLKDLSRFTLVQESSPEVAAGDLVFQPVVASLRLQHLHWDILVPGSANQNLASSIQAGGFPNLRTIRAPSDHDGLLQSVCRPRAQIVQASDKYSKAYRAGVDGTPGSLGRTLFAARKLAQQRIENARASPRFRVIIEEEGVVQEAYDIPGYMGTVGSQIAYNLDSDAQGSDSALVDFPDLLSGIKEVAPRDGCTGMWNASHPAGRFF
ncbi:MAG: hypothetical protein Q9194_001331 [Teloschistes cf. exilis]